MNIKQNPELLDRLAASYALGTLRGGARRRFESMAREHASVRAAALVWQTNWAGLTELQTLDQPSPAVWTRIDNLIKAEQSVRARQATKSESERVSTSVSRWWQNLRLWQGASLTGALAALAAVIVGIEVNTSQQAAAFSEIAALHKALQATPQIQYVSVLQDDKASAAMLVTYDPKHKQLALQRLGAYQEARDRSLQLWALPPTGGPRSLGVLSPQKLLKLAANDGDVKEVPTLAVSLEPLGGVPSATGPTGPVLFKGQLVRKDI